MDWPEFVTEEQKSKSTACGRCGELTGWESVVFELEDAPDPDFQSAASVP